MPNMASVNINYIRENNLPSDVRQQVEQLAGARINQGAWLCLALLGTHVIATSSSRPAGQFARIDFLHVEAEHQNTRLAQVILNHTLKQLHKAGVKEVNTATRRCYMGFFEDAGFMEDSITIPGMHSDDTLIELIQPNLENLQPRFHLLSDTATSPSDAGHAHPASEEKPHSIRFESKANYSDLCRMILCNARRKIYILCESLDDPVLNDRDVIAHMQDLVLHQRHVEVRLLLEKDHRPSAGHSAVLELAQRLSSFVSIRRIHDKRVTPKAWLYLSDDLHAIERRREHGFKGQAFIENPQALQRLSYQFENLWLHSTPSSELRRLAM